MTLERHRSNLIPTVVLDQDGKLSIGHSRGRKIGEPYRHSSLLDLPTRKGPPGAPPDGGMTPNDHRLPMNNLRVDEYANYSDYKGSREGYRDDEQ